MVKLEERFNLEKVKWYEEMIRKASNEGNFQDLENYTKMLDQHKQSK